MTGAVGEDRGHYRHIAAAAGLNPWIMLDHAHPITRAKRSRLRALATGVALVCALIPACDSPQQDASSKSSAGAPRHPPAPGMTQLADARIDLAKLRLDGNAPDEALALILAAIEADATSEEARVMAGEILTKTRWHWPVLTLDHHLPIERIDFASPTSLWVSLSGEANTTARWNLESLQLENLLFPIPPTPTRSLVFDSRHRSVVVERAGVTLLCNAQSLKPVRDLGPLPEFATPTAVIVFSADGLLLAHPAFVSPQNHALVWHVRDAASGEIIRTSEPGAPDRPPPLAAFLNRRSLRVLHADGSLLDMPVSPAEPAQVTPAAAAITLIHAQFADNGGSALTLKNPGPHLTPEPYFISFGGAADSSLEPSRLLERCPWSRHPGLWTGLLRDPARAPLMVDDRTVHLLPGPCAPIFSGSAVTAVATTGELLGVGEKCGRLTIYQRLPVPREKAGAPHPAIPDKFSLLSLKELADALAGVQYNEARRAFVRIDMGQRLEAFKRCNFDALRRIFPTLDFSPLVTAVSSFNPRAATPEAVLPLWDRLARADLTGRSWPGLLEKSKDLSDNAWHRDLAAAVRARDSSQPVDPESSPWLAPVLIEKTFEDGDATAIEAAIHAAGGKGPAAAKAMELALASTHPEWITSCLGQAVDLPPLLRRIAVSRIAWLQNRKADALEGWPEVFPDLAQIRLQEDWDGWEQADYSQALEKLSLCVSEELAAIEVPENSTAEQRKAIAERLGDPATYKAVGRARFAKACLKAALAFAGFKDETATTFTLAARARELGEAPAPCLRAEAVALTALGDYQKAHDRWITLITEHPVENQLPGDYAEASYTAFENADPRQAMAILTTGLHRFPNDGNFALRAGWVALLTGNAERAYRFLLTGRQIGFPPEKLENATALLAIAAEQTGATEDAAAFYQDLIRLDPAWEKPETLESLEWPDELKASLRQLVW